VIHHVVLLNWNPDVSDENIRIVSAGFQQLQKSISEIHSLSFGPNMDLESSNYHYALVAQFKSLDDFNIYTVHPNHQRFMDTITTPIVASYGAVQYSTVD
jgi:hypothetical protein